jgi:hypothetical protein
MKLKIIAALLSSSSLFLLSNAVLSDQDLTNGIEVQSKYDFSFELSGQGLKPIQIFTDGHRTWVQLSDPKRVPLFFANNKPVGYTMDGFLLVIDGLHPEMNLFDAKTNKNTLISYSGIYSTSSSGTLYESAKPVALNGVADAPAEYKPEAQPKIALSQTGRPVRAAVDDVKIEQPQVPVVKERVRKEDYNFKFSVESDKADAAPVNKGEQIYSPKEVELKQHPESTMVTPQQATKRQVAGGVIRKADKPSGFTVAEASSVNSGSVPAPATKSVFKGKTAKVASVADVSIEHQDDAVGNVAVLDAEYQKNFQYKASAYNDLQANMFKTMSGGFVVEKVAMVDVESQPAQIEAKIAPSVKVKSLRVDTSKRNAEVQLSGSLLDGVRSFIDAGLKLVITGHAGMMNEARRVLRANDRAENAMKQIVQSGVNKDNVSVKKLVAHKNAKDWSGVELNITN